MKILLVASTDNWALNRLAHNIRKYINHDISIAYCSQGTPKFNESMINDYDLVHFMNWLDGKECGNRVSVGICSHNFELKWMDEVLKRLHKAKKIGASSRILYDRAKKYNPRVYYTPFGVDIDCFTEQDCTKEFTVGWVGWPTTGGFGEKKSNEGHKVWDIKGYELILKPLMERLKDVVVFKILDNTVNDSIKHSEMNDWYSDINMLICTSLYEGGPLPVFEAAACGKHVLSTKVGRSAELLESNSLIVVPHSRGDIPRVIDEFEKGILWAKMHPGEIKGVGHRLRLEIENTWSWEKIARYWESFFIA